MALHLNLSLEVQITEDRTAPVIVTIVNPDTDVEIACHDGDTVADATARAMATQTFQSFVGEFKEAHS